MKELNNKPELPTAVTRDLGFWQILKLVLYLKIQSLTENYGVLFPKPRVAANRCIQYIFRTYAESFSPIFSERNLLKLLLKTLA